MTKASIDKLVEELNKKYTPEGAKIPVVAKSIDRPDQGIIPCTSPALGFILGTGGWPVGHLVEFFGKEHAGKTTLLMLGLKEAYEYYDGNRAIAFIDIEHRYNEKWAKMLGLPDDLIVVQPENGEQATDIMHTLIKPKTGEGVCAIGFDSIGAASPMREQASFEDRAAIMGGNAMIMTRNVRTIAPVANILGCTVFYTNQLRADMQGYNRPMTPGGFAVKHHMSVRLYLWPNTQAESKKRDKIDGQDVQVGFEMNFRAVKNTFGPPGRDGKSVFYFRSSRLFDGIGFDVEQDIQALGILTEIIERRGAYYNYKDVKAQGRDPFFAAIKEAGLYEELLKDVNGRLDSQFNTMFASDEEKGEFYVEIDDPDL
jgi:recombination protein RecA